MAALQLFLTLLSWLHYAFLAASRPIRLLPRFSSAVRQHSGLPMATVRNFPASSRPVVSRAYRLRSSGTLYLRCGGDDSDTVRWCSHVAGVRLELTLIRGLILPACPIFRLFQPSNKSKRQILHGTFVQLFRQWLIRIDSCSRWW